MPSLLRVEKDHIQRILNQHKDFTTYQEELYEQSSEERAFRALNRRDAELRTEQFRMA